MKQFKDENFSLVFTLDEYLKKKNITYKTLSMYTGISEASICQYCKGFILPNLLYLYRICYHLGITPDEIITVIYQ